MRQGLLEEGAWHASSRLGHSHSQSGQEAGGWGRRQEEGLAQTEALRGRDLAISGSRRKTREVGQGAMEKLAGHGQPADGVWFDFHR